MKLRVYLIENGITITKFAEMLGMNRSYLGLIANGTKTPSKLLAKEIERLTDGKVTVEELLK